MPNIYAKIRKNPFECKTINNISCNIIYVNHELLIKETNSNNFELFLLYSYYKKKNNIYS